MRCEGWRRYGGAFTIGMPTWEQCKNEADVTLRVEQDGKRREVPACLECWREAEERGIKVLAAKPIAAAGESAAGDTARRDPQGVVRSRAGKRDPEPTAARRPTGETASSSQRRSRGGRARSTR